SAKLPRLYKTNAATAEQIQTKETSGDSTESLSNQNVGADVILRTTAGYKLLPLCSAGRRTRRGDIPLVVFGRKVDRLCGGDRGAAAVAHPESRLSGVNLNHRFSQDCLTPFWSPDDARWHAHRRKAEDRGETPVVA